VASEAQHVNANEVSAREIKASQSKIILVSGSWMFKHSGKVVTVST